MSARTCRSDTNVCLQLAILLFSATPTSTLPSSVVYALSFVLVDI
jgi:hypothetical protein